MKYYIVLFFFVLICLPFTTKAQYRMDTLAQSPSIGFPVGITFPPDGSNRVFFTEKNAGRVRIIRNDTLLPTPFLTVSVTNSGEQGLLGITFHPNYPDSPYVYIYYTRSDDRTNMVVRYRDQNNIGIVVDTLMQIPRLNSATNHNGGNIHFGPDGKLYVSVGENATSSNSQDTSNSNKRGKIHRINYDGTTPADNPFPGNSIFVYGCRNSFDFTFDTMTGKMYSTENGPSCNDEVNLLVAGGNYGWPVDGNCTYSGSPAYKKPLYYWPSNLPAVTGIVMYRGNAFPDLYGKLLVASYNSQSIFIFTLNGTGDSITSGPTTLLNYGSALDDIEVGPDGYIYIANGSYNGDSHLIRLKPTISIPPSPALISPVNSSVNQPRKPTFLWHKATEATSYYLQVASDSLFTSLVYSDSTLTDTSKLSSTLSYDTKYFWHVRAKNSAGASSFSATWNFTTIIATPQIPTLEIPGNGSINQSLTPTVQWLSAPRAETYRLQVAQDSLFSNIVFDGSGLTDTLKELDTLLYGTTYYWRVNAINVGGTSAYSQIWKFTTIPTAPPSPLLLSPENNAVDQLSSVMLLWQPSEFAETYHVQISSDSGFSATIREDSLLTETSDQIDSLTYHTSFYWRVRAINSIGSSPWSEIWKFTTSDFVTKTIFLTNRWNLLSLPLKPLERNKNSLFPASISSAFEYIPITGYSSRDSLTLGKGFWLKFPDSSGMSASITGNTVTTDTISVTEGWNLVGSISDTLWGDSIVSIPPGIIISPFYGYNQGYISSPNIIAPGKGYWVRVNAPGQLLLSSVENVTMTPQDKINEDDLTQFSRLVIEDTQGNHQTLYFGNRESLPANKSSQSYELPPTPTLAIFDARFTSGKFLETVTNDKTQILPILISSAQYPLSLRWELKENTYEAILNAKNRQINMKSGNSTMIFEPVKQLSIQIIPVK